METNPTTMNDSPESAARPETGGANAEKAEEGPSSSPSQSTIPAAPLPAAAEAPASRTTFLERLANLFRHRNGSSLREEIADALAETDEHAESFSPGERAMLNNILRLREVRVSGNQYTRDEVIRREISVLPGEWIDTEELAKSQDRLLSLQYFGDPATADPGVSMRLKPVPGDDDLVDLEVVTKDGTTGQFLWGVGVSSNTILAIA